MWTKHGIMTDRGIVSGFSWNVGKGLALVEEQSVRFCGWSASESDPDPGFLHVFDGKLAAVITKECFGYDPARLGVTSEKILWMIQILDPGVLLQSSGSTSLQCFAAVDWVTNVKWFLKKHISALVIPKCCLGGVTSQKKAAVPKTEGLCAR